MPVGHTATQQAGSGGLAAIEHRLGNGLRLVLSEDHLNPVAAICVWYDVGSRHEARGRTGLAHLFEHLMFQGSAQVAGNGHFELVQGAGGWLNGTTSFERTNYFETMRGHTRSWGSSVTSPGSRHADGSRSTSAPSRPTTARSRPATVRSPTSSARNSGRRSGRRSRRAR